MADELERVLEKNARLREALERGTDETIRAGCQAARDVGLRMRGDDGKWRDIDGVEHPPLPVPCYPSARSGRGPRR